jgi:dTDP-4-dehydrorhamnose reductase
MRRPILIAGAEGQLGTALQMLGPSRGFQTFAPDEGAFDITSPESVEESVAAFARVYPEGAVLNAAAYTNVDKAEEDATRAFLVNQYGAALLAETAASWSLPYVHISTDMVFDGKKMGSYNELDEPNPLNVYGSSKMAGEWAVVVADPRALIVRTAWTFGPGGNNFVNKILEQSEQTDKIQVVTDEVGSPTYTMDLADALLRLIDIGATGLMHVTNSGWCARDEYAREILRLAGKHKIDVVSVRSSAFPSKADRPANSVLDCSRAGIVGIVMPSWRDGLTRYMHSL